MYSLNKQISRITPNKWASFLLWGFGWSNTYRFFYEITSSVLFGFLYSLPLQLLLTYLQHLLWNPKVSLVVSPDGKPERDQRGQKIYRKHRMGISWLALFVDVMLNVGGTWFLLKDIYLSSSVMAIFDAFDLGVPTIPKKIIFGLSVLMGYFTAVAPEQLFKITADHQPQYTNRGGMITRGEKND